jgi:hypothetical protein
MLFILSLLFVTLMQIVVIHSSDKKIILTYSWRSGVSSFSSSLMSNVTTSSSSILKQMLTGLKYGSNSDGKGSTNKTAAAAGTATASGTSNASAAAATSSSTTTTMKNNSVKKKKTDVLRIEAMLDRSLPSRDVNVKVLQNYANSARIREIIHLLQEKGALDSSPDSSRIILPWTTTQSHQSYNHSSSQGEGESDGSQISGSTRITKGSNPNAFPSHQPERASAEASAFTGKEGGGDGMAAVADDDHGDGDQRRIPALRHHQEGSSRRFPAAASVTASAAGAGVTLMPASVGNVDHENPAATAGVVLDDNEIEEKNEKKIRQREEQDDGGRGRRKSVIVQGNQRSSSRQEGESRRRIALSSSSSPSSSSSNSVSSSQGNQEIDFLPPERREQDGSGNSPEASLIVNSTGAASLKQSPGDSLLQHPSSLHANIVPGERKDQTRDPDVVSSHNDVAHEKEEDSHANPGDSRGRRRELNEVDISVPDRDGNLGSNAELIEPNSTTSKEEAHKSSSLFHQLMSSSSSNKKKTTCSLIPPDLQGRIDINMDPVIGENMSEIIRLNPNVGPGGHFAPSSCYPRHVVAIIIPYRDRMEHLSILLYNLHPILQRQQLEYRIYVAEQAGNETFNKGVLMNAGVREALKDADFHCFIFHDVDLIPEDDRNLYTCPISPRHMSYAVNKFNYT